MQDLFFAFEIKIDRAVGHVGRARNVRHLGIEIAVARKDARGRAQNQFPLPGRSVSSSFLSHPSKLNESSLSGVSVAVTRFSGNQKRPQLRSSSLPERSSLLAMFERYRIRRKYFGEADK